MTSISSKGEKRLGSSGIPWGQAAPWQAVAFSAQVTEFIDPPPGSEVPSKPEGKRVGREAPSKEKKVKSEEGYTEYEIRTYMLSSKVEDGFVQFYFKQRPPRPDYSNDGELDVRVPNDCWIRFVLDPDLRWSFRHVFGADDPCECKTDKDCDETCNDALTLGRKARDDLYTDLRHISDQEIMFFAKKYIKKDDVPAVAARKSDAKASEHSEKEAELTVDADPQMDDFNIYVEMEQMTAQMTPGKKKHYKRKRMSIRIDPDMQNPGDDTGHPKVKELEDEIFFLLDKAQMKIQSLEVALKKK